MLHMLFFCVKSSQNNLISMMMISFFNFFWGKAINIFLLLYLVHHLFIHPKILLELLLHGKPKDTIVREIS